MLERGRPDQAKLYGIAEAQSGLFTTKQAKACGYAENTHPYHVKRGHWLRERRGIYRLALFPVSDEEQLVLWSLWSANRSEQPQGVFSHATALAIHDLSDAAPDKLHLTVPKTFRRFHEPPAVLVLHKDDLIAEEIENRRGYAVTTPLRTLRDVAADDASSDELIEQALRDALRAGLVSRTALARAAASFPERLRRLTKPQIHR